LAEMLIVSHHKTWPCYEKDTTASGMDWYFWYNLSKVKGTRDSALWTWGACIGEGHLRQWPGY
jgi:hypothetical protein